MQVAAAATLVLMGVLLSPRAAEARRGRGGSAALAQDVGIGLIVGSPTGLSLEARLGGRTSFDFALGIDAFDDDENFYVHFDYLVMPAILGSGGAVDVPLYLGVGGVIWDRGGDFGDDLHLGVRVPFGLAFAFRRAPLQIFAELAIRVLFYSEIDDDNDADVTGALGFRVYF
jgi:hypothetical protein